MPLETTSAQDTAVGDQDSARQQSNPEGRAGTAPLSAGMAMTHGAGEGAGSLLARFRSADTQGRRSLFRR